MADEAIELLAEHMARDSRTIAFVGAGASVRCNYPTWGELVARLRVRAVGSETTLPDLDLRSEAELYAETLADRGDLEDEVRNALLARRVRSAGEFHRKLARLPFSHFITTNYDRLIEEAVNAELRDTQAAELGIAHGCEISPNDACRALNGRTTRDFNQFLAGLALDEPKRTVLHLHGLIDGEMTLTLGQYDDQYMSDAMERRMFSIFATTTVVFIGASLNDPDVMELVRRSNYHGAKRPRHFAFLDSSRRLEERMLKKTYGIRPIYYDRDVPDHKDLDYQLDQLYELWLRASHMPEGKDPCTGEARSFRDAIVEIDLEQEQPARVDITGLVEEVEARIRRTPQGAVTFSGLNPTTASATMRHVARRYRELPKGRTFDKVVWLSPRRLGLFPPTDGQATTRRVAEVLFGAIAGELGAHRLTATLDRERNLTALRTALEEREPGRRRRALLVIEDAETLLAWHDHETGGADSPDGGNGQGVNPIDEIAGKLPVASRAVYRQDGDDADADRAVAAPEPELAEPSEARFRSALPKMTPSAAQILAALAISAHPLDEAELAAMLDQLSVSLPEQENGDDGTLHANVAALRAIARDCGDLADEGFAIRDPRRGPEPGNSGRCAYTVTAPMRSTILASAPFRDNLVTAATSLLRWAEGVVSTLRKWEVDHVQFERLTGRMPVLLSIFDAGCWLGLHQPDAEDAEPAAEKGGEDQHQVRRDKHRVERLLWLGRNLSRLLYTAGRWPEARQIADFLVVHTEDLDLGDAGTLNREAHLLMATILAHAELDDSASPAAGSDGTTDGDDSKKAKHARRVVQSARRLIDHGWERAAHAYPPARITPERQERQGRLRLAQVLPDRTKAHDELQALYEEIAEKLADAKRKEDEDRQILGDVAGYLAEQKLARLGTDVPLEDLMRVLDDGLDAFSKLGNRRRLGHHARLRGEVLLRAGNYLAARRSYAEALLVSSEFRDRFLEAQAKLGLAVCDRSWQLADDACRLFDELRVQSEEERAEEVRNESPRNGAVRPARTPDIVVFIGAPGSGKGLARDVAVETLDGWGYDERFMRFDPTIDERLRKRDDVAAEDIRAEIARQLEIAEAEADKVLLTKLSLWDKGYIGPFDEERDLLRRMLVVSLAAPRTVLRRRNEQRFSGELPDDIFNGVDEETGHAEPPAGYRSWRSWFEERGAAYVEIVTGYRAGAADVPVRRQSRRIREELELSFVSPECILRNRGLSAGGPCATATG